MQEERKEMKPGTLIEKAVELFIIALAIGVCTAKGATEYQLWYTTPVTVWR
jgi:hypothetical protein